MPLLAALWLALVAVLAAAPAPRLAGVAAGGGPTSGAETRPSRQDPAPRDEALRAPRTLQALGAARAEVPRAHPPRSHAPQGVALSGWPSASVAPVADARAARQPSHAPAARGGLLPYFPTAPPLQG